MKRFEWKWPNTRKPDNMIVYPIDPWAPDERQAQGSRSIVRFNIHTGEGIANWKGSNSKYGFDLLVFRGAERVTMPREFIDAALAVQFKSGDEVGPGVFIA